MDVWFNSTTLYLTDYKPVGSSSFDFIFTGGNETPGLQREWLVRHGGHQFHRLPASCPRSRCLPFSTQHRRRGPTARQGLGFEVLAPGRPVRRRPYLPCAPPPAGPLCRW